MNTPDSLASKWLDRASSDHTIVFLLDALKQNNCPTGPLSSLVKNTTCGPDRAGGFAMNVTSIESATLDKSSQNYGGKKISSAPKPTIVICQNNIYDYPDYLRTLSHELIHSIDQCRAKADWSNLKHHACSEIRASNLSGECGYGVELLRGNMKHRGGHIDCVMRRANLSLKANPNENGEGEEVIKEVFPQCYADLYPFMRHPGSN
ncbi:hypothetical protein TrVE_jg6537 [Triparma verrucosa]|uniref:Mitochondrial inner membrane protease ATP23 n=1 Tax=Triparma verrucosa TaxID=1606542 RepID=A0A9W7KU87_9STRA|nr:hypothetical protein TrVE_jg6537 [Triparma verrucosa]